MKPEELRIGNYVSHNGYQFKEWQFIGGDIQYAIMKEIHGELILTFKTQPIEERLIKTHEEITEDYYELPDKENPFNVSPLEKILFEALQ